MELRGYQADVAAALDAAHAAHRRVLCQLPTGGGKTVLAAHQLTAHAAKACCWLTHRDVLRDQTAATLRAFGLPVADWAAAKPARRLWQPGVAIITERLRSLPAPPADAGLLVIDEAHHSVAPTWAQVIDGWPGPVLGLTATPWRMSDSQGFDGLFDTLVRGPSVAELTEAGALARAVTVLPSEMAMNTGNLSRGTGGDWSASSAGAETERLLRLRSVVEWHAEAVAAEGFDPQGARTLWFCATVAAAEQLAELLGPAAAAVTGGTPTAERRRLVAGLARGDLRHLTSCEVFTEGLDVPAVDVAVMLRPTKSLALHLQMCGRALRPPGPVLILDCAGNTAAHGLVDEPRVWSLAARDVDPPGGGQPWTSLCPWAGCGRAQPTAVRDCRSCWRPVGKTCTGCARWKHLGGYKSADLEAAECAECVAAARERAKQTGSRRREELVARLAAGEKVGGWWLSQRGNPTMCETVDGGDRWTVVHVSGAVLRKEPSGGWRSVGWLRDDPALWQTAT